MSTPTTAEEKTKKKNDVKARGLLLMALPNEHRLTFSQYPDAKSRFAAVSLTFSEAGVLHVNWISFGHCVSVVRRCSLAYKALRFTVLFCDVAKKNAEHEACAISDSIDRDFDGNTILIPYDAPNFKEAESSTIALDPSNMHEFHQVQPSTHIWTKSHPLEQVIVSTFEPKNIKEAMSNHSWIESMQDELHQFKRLDVWKLVPRPDGKNIIDVKWLWKNKNDVENIVIRNKSCLVAKGYKQEA
ncbi:hypothetical protein Tco_0660795 [Tanacetum coccineum]